MQVTIYRVNSGFANVQDRLTLSEPSADVIFTSAEYMLPDGYTFDVDKYGDPYILDASGADAVPVLRNNTVILVTHHGATAIRKAMDGRQTTSLKQARISAGLTQKQLSDASGVNIRQIQRVELGSSDPGNLTARNLLAIADALGVDPHELIGGRP